MMCRRLFFLFFLLFSLSSVAQTGNVFRKPEPVLSIEESIIDPEYGINHYDKLNPKLGGDSVRNCNGYACQGWQEDYYKNGQVCHKGYYVDGQLQVFKNFYPNGQLEREFRNTDLTKSSLVTFYSDGKVRTRGLYNSNGALKYEEFYPNGNLSFLEEYHKSQDYYLVNQSNYEDGKPESVLTLEDPKKLVFNKVEYFENGKVKEQGKLIFNKEVSDYQKIDKWLFFNEDGTPLKEVLYDQGKAVKEVPLKK